MKECYRKFLGLGEHSSSDEEDDGLSSPLAARRMHLMHGSRNSVAGVLHPTFGHGRGGGTTHEGAWGASGERPRRAKQLSEAQLERIAQREEMAMEKMIEQRESLQLKRWVAERCRSKGMWR